MSLPDWLVNKIKGFEGTRGAKQPYWDYKQWSGAYGTRANGPNDRYDLNEAERRLRNEVGKSWNTVNKRYPNLPETWRGALTSLTYNAGGKWMNSGLGRALSSGNLDEARRRFAQYNKAGGKTLPGLANRRQKEISWLGGNVPPQGGNTTMSSSGTRQDALNRYLQSMQGSLGPEPEGPTMQQRLGAALSAWGDAESRRHGININTAPIAMQALQSAQAKRAQWEKNRRSLMGKGAELTYNTDIRGIESAEAAAKERANQEIVARAIGGGQRQPQTTAPAAAVAPSTFSPSPSPSAAVRPAVPGEQSQAQSIPEGYGATPTQGGNIRAEAEAAFAPTQSPEVNQQLELLKGQVMLEARKDPAKALGTYRAGIAKAKELKMQAQDMDLKERRFGLDKDKFGLNTDLEYQRKLAEAKSGGAVVGKMRAAAREGYPQVETETENITRQIDGILNHPYFGTQTSIIGGNLPDVSGGAQDFTARIEQLRGKGFLAAFEKLKGAGQITEVEGKKASEAIARLQNVPIGSENFKTALADFKRELKSLKELARRKAGLSDAPKTLPKLDRKTAVQQARQAIKNGANRKAVIERLKQMGHSAAGL